MENSIQQAFSLGQAIWLDYIRRGLIKSGEFEKLISLGITGLTANPTIMEKAIVGSTDYDEALASLGRKNLSNEEIYEKLAIEDIRSAADLLRPVFNRTKGEHGYACLEITPTVAHDTQKTIAEGKRLFAKLDRPNVMVKVPATEEGIPAIRKLTSEGISVNVTLIFSLKMYERVREAYISGLEDLEDKKRDVGKVFSVASFFLSRIDTLVDDLLMERVRKGEKELNFLSGKTAVASAKLAYRDFKNSFYNCHFEELLKIRGHVQKPLWASTSTKNPAYEDLKYVDLLIGRDTVNTLPPGTINAFLDHGHAAATIEDGVEQSEKDMAALEAAGIKMEEVASKLLENGVKAFDDSYTKLISGIEKKRQTLDKKIHYFESNLPYYNTRIEKAIAAFSRQDIVSRIWRRDYTVWKPDPPEIYDRLDWLTVPDLMQEKVPALESFAKTIVNEGYKNTVLLGMGGSSLGAEVLNKSVGNSAGFPNMIVLDSVIPSAVEAVANGIDPAHTLFIVSSKSGSTREPLVLYKYFEGLVESKLGTGNAGTNFIAITDPHSPLTRIAERDKFREVFSNPPNIGGRYSVLSYFGLVPAALLGLKLELLLDRANRGREACASCVPGYENPGLWLGICLGSMAKEGRDKLTLIMSPRLNSLGLWIEQLIAESTGKESKGILPVVGEPMSDPADYSNDRFFVYIRLDGDDNGDRDAFVENMKAAGHPIITRKLFEIYDLGTEFFYWEFATAVAGAVLGINPFDQPDVQRAKDATERLIGSYVNSGSFAAINVSSSLDYLLSKEGKGKYLAIMAYLQETQETNKILDGLRKYVLKQYHIPSTLGYGPRFLHSTGQFHKGGPNTGLFIQVTEERQMDLKIPGEPYTLGIVADAEAQGDLETLIALNRAVASIRKSSGEKLTLSVLHKNLAAA